MRAIREGHISDVQLPKRRVWRGSCAEVQQCEINCFACGLEKDVRPRSADDNLPDAVSVPVAITLPKLDLVVGYACGPKVDQRYILVLTQSDPKCFPGHCENSVLRGDETQGERHHGKSTRKQLVWATSSGIQGWQCRHTVRWTIVVVAVRDSWEWKGLNRMFPIILATADMNSLSKCHTWRLVLLLLNTRLCR